MSDKNISLNAQECQWIEAIIMDNESWIMHQDQELGFKQKIQNERVYLLLFFPPKPMS